MIWFDFGFLWGSNSTVSFHVAPAPLPFVSSQHMGPWLWTSVRNISVSAPPLPLIVLHWALSCSLCSLGMTSSWDMPLLTPLSDTCLPVWLHPFPLPLTLLTCAMPSFPSSMAISYTNYLSFLLSPKCQMSTTSLHHSDQHLKGLLGLQANPVPICWTLAWTTHLAHCTEFTNGFTLPSIYMPLSSGKVIWLAD